MKLRNLRESQEFDALAAHIIGLKEFKDEKLVFSPAVGNWGDGLINFGSRQFLKANELSWEEIHKSQHTPAVHANEYRGRLVIAGGGGAWGRNWKRNRGIISNIADQARHVVVLPTTFDLPRLHHRNISYFTRDKYSSARAVRQAEFCHDMAFYSHIVVPEPEQIIWRLFAMREDHEGHEYGKNFPLNLDVSKLGNGETRNMLPVLNIINQYQVVTTDRLHVAIAGAMLGVKVNLVSGNYSKNLDLFKSSIQNNFQDIRMREFIDVLKWYEFDH